MPSQRPWLPITDRRYANDIAYEDFVCAGFKTDPLLTVSEWADTYRMLTTRLSAEPGPYRTSRAPFLKDIMDALSPSHPAQRVVFMKASQVGATEAGNNWLGYIMHWVPSPILSVWPTLDMAKRGSRNRIEPLIEDTPALRAIIAPSKDRDSGNTVLIKSFPGGILVITGANSATGLRSMPARFNFSDEIDAFPGDIDQEGDPIALIKARMTTFGRAAKMFLVSTPTVHGASRIEKEYAVTDQRRFFVPCPHCQAKQWLKFDRLRWTKGAPETAVYVCEFCEETIEEREKARMLPAGEWQPTAEPKDKLSIGFHISGLYRPLGWLSWETIAREWEESEDDASKRKGFVNTRLGECFFEEADLVEWERVYERREQWRHGTLPMGVSILLAAVDVQASPARLELHIWGWGVGLESWAIDRIEITGRADDPATWAKLTEQLQESYSHPCGVDIRPELVAVDTGDQAPAVYSWISQQDQSKILAIKGKRGYEINAPVGTPTNIPFGKRKKAIRLRSVTGDVFKAELYQFLNLNRVDDGSYPPGFVHVPNYLDAEWCKQLVAERRVKTKTGRYEWLKDRHPRNEALDCRVYARAALWTLGVAAWKPERWLRERQRRGIMDAEIARKEQKEERKTGALEPKKSLNEPKFAKDSWFGAERGNLRGDW